MKQDKTRKDFYLTEDYEAYRAEFAFKAFVLEKLKLDPRDSAGLLELAEGIQSRAYAAGYSNAEFDAQENL